MLSYQVDGQEGLLLEPVPSVFDRIKQREGNVYENAAVCNTTGFVPFYTVCPNYEQSCSGRLKQHSKQVRPEVDLHTGIDNRNGRYIHKYRRPSARCLSIPALRLTSARRSSWLMLLFQVCASDLAAEPLLVCGRVQPDRRKRHRRGRLH